MRIENNAKTRMELKIKIFRESFCVNALLIALNSSWLFSNFVQASRLDLLRKWVVRCVTRWGLWHLMRALEVLMRWIVRKYSGRDGSDMKIIGGDESWKFGWGWEIILINFWWKFDATWIIKTIKLWKVCQFILNPKI